jgi:serine protease Do
VAALDPVTRHQFGVAEDRKGVVVVSVDPRSPAADRNLQVGMIITEAAGQPVGSVAEFTTAVKKVSGKPLLLYIQAPQGSQRITLAIPPR